MFWIDTFIRATGKLFDMNAVCIGAIEEFRGGGKYDAFLVRMSFNG